MVSFNIFTKVAINWIVGVAQKKLVLPKRVSYLPMEPIVILQ